MDLLGIGFAELLMILLIGFIFLGPDKLPGFARGLGQFMSKLKMTSAELTRELAKEIELDKEAQELKNEVTKLANEMSGDLREIGDFSAGADPKTEGRTHASPSVTSVEVTNNVANRSEQVET